MKKILLPFLLFLLAACQSQQVALNQLPLLGQQTLDPSTTISTIAFGSCNDINKPQIIWPAILQQQADLWVWLGDIIYADTKDMQQMKRQYMRQKYQKDYIRLRQQMPVIGTWDDHDYGSGDGGKHFSKKRESQQLLLDFLDIPDSSDYRKQKGVYQSYSFGKAPRIVKIILLDVRYFRDDLVPTESGVPRYYPNSTGDILGQAQWEWLANELSGSEAAVHLIGSGIQVIPEEQPFESWANFPQARARLFHLIDSLQPAATLLLSGDRHIAEISRIELPQLPYPLFEVTSSGLTHSYEEVGEELNRYRISELVNVKNFGLLKIDWRQEHLQIQVEIRGVENGLLISKLLRFL